MPLDFKKTEKELYQPKTTPSIVDVPQMNFICIKGKGDPNKSEEYAQAIQALYGLSYAIKMSNKHILEYVVPPLEGFWQVDDKDYKGGGLPITDKSKFIWTAMIRQPDFVDKEVFETAKATLAKKKPEINVSRARLETITEGLCVQIMHIGSYDDEPATILTMDTFAIGSGYTIDINDKRHHHEIYLSDPRKTPPVKLKTVIRHPIRRT